MPLVPCPHCGRSISVKARRCRFCRQVIVPAAATPATASSVPEEDRTQRRSDFADVIADATGESAGEAASCCLEGCLGLGVKVLFRAIRAIARAIFD